MVCLDQVLKLSVAPFNGCLKKGELISWFLTHRCFRVALKSTSALHVVFFFSERDLRVEREEVFAEWQSLVPPLLF